MLSEEYAHYYIVGVVVLPVIYEAVLIGFENINTDVLELGWNKSSIFHSISVDKILFKLNEKEIKKAWYQNMASSDVEYFIKKAKEETK